MTTYIVRVAPVQGAIAGTIERPGEERRTFRYPDELVSILTDWERNDGDQSGKAPGSTPISRIRDT